MVSNPVVLEDPTPVVLEDPTPVVLQVPYLVVLEDPTLVVPSPVVLELPVMATEGVPEQPDLPVSLVTVLLPPCWLLRFPILLYYPFSPSACAVGPALVPFPASSAQSPCTTLSQDSKTQLSLNVLYPWL